MERSFNKLYHLLKAAFKELSFTIPESEYETLIESPTTFMTPVETPAEPIPVALTYSTGDTGDSIKEIQTSLNNSVLNYLLMEASAIRLFGRLKNSKA